MAEKDSASATQVCEAIRDRGRCDAAAPRCVSIVGQRCQPDGGEAEVFGMCVSAPAASQYTIAKMDMEKPLPAWMVSHPDMTYRCAHPPSIPTTSARFTGLYPPEWVQNLCAGCCIPPEKEVPSPESKISLIVTIYQELPSFQASAKTWKQNGLLDYVDERIAYIDGGENRDKIEAVARSFGFRVINSDVNQGIGKGIATLVDEAQGPFILFLEKDWHLVEPARKMHSQLELGKRLLITQANGSRADAVKYRSRHKPGVPNIHPQKTHPPEWDYEEGINMWYTKPGWEPHLFCNIYHFENDNYLLRRHPNRMWRCGCEHNFWCFDAGQCGWTNNPFLFKKDWFISSLRGIAVSGHNNFEGSTYYSTEWLLPHWVVASGDGLFEHREVSEAPHSEFW